MRIGRSFLLPILVLKCLLLSIGTPQFALNVVFRESLKETSNLASIVR